MQKDRIDLRSNEWREAIVKISNAVNETQLTNRALALLIIDSLPSSTKLGLRQVVEVLKAIPRLKANYLKK